jgi:hypothetical protein
MSTGNFMKDHAKRMAEAEKEGISSNFMGAAIGEVKNPEACRKLLQSLTDASSLKCYGCGKASSLKRFPTCSRCKTAHYCTPQCQKDDWKNHKKMCRATLGVGDLVRVHNVPQVPAGMILEVFSVSPDGKECGITMMGNKQGLRVDASKCLTRVCFKEMRGDAF